MLQPIKHNMVWEFLAKNLCHKTPLYSGFSGKIKYLRHYFSRTMILYKCGRDMTHSICLMILYQTTIRKKSIFVSELFKPVFVCGSSWYLYINISPHICLFNVMYLDRKQFVENSSKEERWRYWAYPHEGYIWRNVFNRQHYCCRQL